MLNVVMINVVFLFSVIILNAVMPNVFMPNAVMPNVVASFFALFGNVVMFAVESSTIGSNLLRRISSQVTPNLEVKLLFHLQ